MTKPTDLVILQQWWREALAGDPRQTFNHLGDQWQPQVGFYRIKKAAGSWYPVAIWMDQPVDDDGELCADETIIAKVGNRTIKDEMEIENLWFKCCLLPVSYEAYTYALQYGAWADDPKETVKPEPVPKIIAAEAPALF